MTVLLLCACVAGCVRRRLTIRSNPPGADVYIDDQPIGQTPVSTSFTHYGTRKIRLEMDGRETVDVKQTFRQPWYQYPVLDFITENLWPRELRDERVVDFQMPVKQQVTDRDLLDRAESLRTGARQGYVTPLPQSTPTGAPPASRGELPIPLRPGDRTGL